jgi:hypothetical protein
MDPQSIFIPARRRVGRKRGVGAASSPGPAALTLVSAVYSPATAITLTFDRPIDISAIVGSAIRVNDGVNESTLWQATGSVTLMDPVTVELGLAVLGPPQGPGVTLTALGTNGIVAVDDGAAWAGAVHVELPFP